MEKNVKSYRSIKEVMSKASEDIFAVCSRQSKNTLPKWKSGKWTPDIVSKMQHDIIRDCSLIRMCHSGTWTVEFETLLQQRVEKLLAHRLHFCEAHAR